jgi:hypothetical protein
MQMEHVINFDQIERLSKLEDVAITHIDNDTKHTITIAFHSNPGQLVIEPFTPTKRMVEYAMKIPKAIKVEVTKDYVNNDALLITFSDDCDPINISV